ncbi:MAG TPA: PilZ domain-containing protein [Thermodesulforhabdus norvegica]|uniref:PilZ domain-containing protein n=1 Tax=Thermodesulforhabdus norvegica TaxID=39841 RepID=A0A7C1AVC7_9BACT|nr:PilZ domain-containing protein [Thermodesulforhabdus norvegica]
MTMTTDRRDYLRIHIPYLHVHYNILPEDVTPVLPKRHKTGKLTADEEANLEPIYRVLLEKLENLETKVDYLLKWLGKAREDKPFDEKAEVINIGGGGLSFRTSRKIEEGTFIELCISSEVGEMVPIFAIGRVCWVEKNPENADRPWTVGICFEDILEDDRQIIMRMIFDAERKQKR